MTLTTRSRLPILLAAWCLLASPIAAADLQVQETDAAIEIASDGKSVLVYNKQSPPVPDGIDPIYHRSGFLHPVASPAGNVVTAAFPADHPHQQGIFSAWVRTNHDGREIDFWNLAGGVGRVSHERVVKTFTENESAGFEVDLIHHTVAEPKVDILRERWRITVQPTDGSYRCFDLQTTQQALTDKPLTVEKYHYGGIATRGPARWSLPTGKKAAAKASDADNNKPSEPISEIVDEHGHDRIAGNHHPTRWVTLSGSEEGEVVCITMLGHADNFRAPQPARLHPSMPYFCFAPCVTGEFQITKDQPYEASFRFLVTDGKPDPAWIEQQWQAWCGDKAQ
ncbi:PmoA family protein [Rosistilla oblonga]|uniref:DUF6807 domain-containing protein n=1 Tax=Rosistilla oblonga TaxID=2527990 RepID=UPI003A97605E